MRRSIQVVCALGSVVLLGTLVSRGDSPGKSVANKTGAAEKKNLPAMAAIRRWGAEAIEAALEQRIPCEFVETPLKDVVDYIRDAAKVEVWVDEPALKEEGVELEVPVTCGLRDSRLENVLSILLSKHHLAIAIHDDVLWITSEAKAQEFVETRTYDVADLVVYKDDKSLPVDDYQPLIDVMENAVSPASWDHNGGRGSISGASLGTAKVLVVSSTRQAHREIRDLLSQIRTIAAKKSAGDGLPRRVLPQHSNETDKQPTPPASSQSATAVPAAK